MSNSDYYLTGLIICPECGQKHVGTAAYGRNRVYRYYTCVRRTRYGPAGCTAPRLNADIVDDTILAALANFYTGSGLLAEAVSAAQEDRDSVRRRRQGELATVERELVNARAALDRYFTAFESGTLDSATCGQRVRALHARVTQLSQRRYEIARSVIEPVSPADPVLVEQVRHHLAAVLRAGTAVQRKAVIETHVAEVRIEHGTITPVFKLPPRR